MDGGVRKGVSQSRVAACLLAYWKNSLTDHLVFLL